MSFHAFAVWDFMSLLKSLQTRLTVTRVPWIPSGDPAAARLINEIVLVEESDEIEPGVYMSHYELYLRAMREVGANLDPIEGFVRRVADGAPVDAALRGGEVPPFVADFVRTSLAQSLDPLHATAAAFLYGREDVIPEMFGRILHGIEIELGARCESFRLYLKRHIEIDANAHAPMARELLGRLGGQDPARWNEAFRAAERALEARGALWDAILADEGA